MLLFAFCQLAGRRGAPAAAASRLHGALNAGIASSSRRCAPPTTQQQLQQRGPLGVELARDVRKPGKPAAAPAAVAAAGSDSKCGPLDEDDAADYVPMVDPLSGEWGGPTKGGAMPEPTRFGDWERKGRCTDFN